MNENLRTLSVFLRAVVGILLTTIFFLNGPTWSLVGLYFLITAALRFCFVKKIMTG